MVKLIISVKCIEEIPKFGVMYKLAYSCDCDTVVVKYCLVAISIAVGLSRASIE